MITTQNLTFAHPKQTAINFPDIALEKAEHLLVLGPSGVGKTTLLHLLSGLLKPSKGNILINQTALESLSQSNIDKFRQQHIGIVFQKSECIASLNVLENIKAKLYFSKARYNAEEISELLNSLGLLDKKYAKVSALSEGQKQRLSIAIAVCNHPSVILADEPTASLDDQNAKIVTELLLRYAEEYQANLIVITHDNRMKSYFQKSITL